MELQIFSFKYKSCVPQPVSDGIITVQYTFSKIPLGRNNAFLLYYNLEEKF